LLRGSSRAKETEEAEEKFFVEESEMANSRFSVPSYVVKRCSSSKEGGREGGGM
jgi:hypothetical protein